MRAKKCALMLCLLLLSTSVAACSARQRAPGPTGLPTASPTPLPPTLTPTSVPSERPTAPVEPLPSPVEASTVEPSPAEPPASTAPPEEAIRIQFEAGATSEVLTGHVEAGGIEQYVIRASADQVMHVRADSPTDAILLEITGPGGAPIEGRAAGKAFWRGKLPATQDYLINVASSGEAADYQLGVIIYARITFDRGESSATLTGRLGGYETDHYVLQAQEGQTMDVVAEAPEQVGLTIWGADGIPLKRYVDEERAWRGELPKTQDYFIEVNAIETTDYTLTVSIPSLSRQAEAIGPASIEVVSPSGGVEWLEGSTHNVTWTSSGVEKVDIGVASGDKPLGQIALGVDATSGQLPWDIPVGLISNFGVAESDSMWVRISSSDDPSHYDENDDAFTIQCPRIRFEPGATSASVPGTLKAAGDRFRYVLGASAGQMMEMQISPAQIRVDVWGAQDGSTWDIPMGQSSLTIPSLPASQDYFITLTSPPEAEAIGYTLDVVIR